MRHRAWIEVDLGALRHNYAQVRTLAEGAEVIAVVKANAYGHGITQSALALESVGAKMLAVTYVEEAEALRGAGVSARILVLAPPLYEEMTRAVALGLDVCVSDAESMDAASRAAYSAGRDVTVHLKVDTGMGRLGVLGGQAAEGAETIARLPGLKLGGVFSHCAQGADEQSASEQLEVFRGACSQILERGIEIPMCHLAASAALLSSPATRLDAARVGTLLYGQYPTRALQKAYQGKTLELRQTWMFQARVISVRSLPKGASVGYGAEYRTRRRSRIAVVAAGIADGLGMEPVSLRRKGWRGAARAMAGPAELSARVENRTAPIVGRIGMQMCCVDVTGIPGVSVGDAMVLPVRRLSASALIPRVFIGV